MISRPEHLSPAGPAIRFWRESLFFVMHRPDRLGDALALTVSSQPSRESLDSFQLGTIDGQEFFRRHHVAWPGALPEMAVGPAAIEVIEPYRELRLRVDPERSPCGLDVTFTARSAPYLLKPGELRLGADIVWQQEQMVQSGRYDGWYSAAGRRYPVRGWWGQRDHSWGIREHRRVPMWLWLAIQLPSGMLSTWCWETADETRCYTDGCWAPADGGPPVPVLAVEHDLRWLDARGRPCGAAGTAHGLSGQIRVSCADGDCLVIDGTGSFAARYGRRGGGLVQMRVTSRRYGAGTAIYELTGSDHRRYFPRRA